MKMFNNVEIPQEAFFAVFSVKSENEEK